MTAEQLWAVCAQDGSYVLRWTAKPQINPRRSASVEEKRGRREHRLDREPVPALGETVRFEDGAIIFNAALVLPGLIAKVKAEAARRVEAVAPLWRQMNDALFPDEPGVEDRKAFIKAVRTYSNQAEAQLGKADSARALVITMAAISAGWPEFGKKEVGS